MNSQAFPLFLSFHYFMIGCWPVLLMLLIGLILLVAFQVSTRFRNFFGLTFFALPATILILFSIVGLIYSGFEIKAAISKQKQLAFNLIQENERQLVQSIKNGDYLEASKILEEIGVKGSLQGSRLYLAPTKILAASFGHIIDGGAVESLLISSPDLDGSLTSWGTVKYQVNQGLIQQSVSQIAKNWGRTMIWISISILLSAGAVGLYFFRHLKRSSRFVFNLKKKVEQAGSAEELVLGVESVEYKNAYLEEEIDLRNNLQLIAKEMAALNVKWLRSESEAAVGRLATQVAHDIRSPLTVLNLSLGGLKNTPEEIRNIILEAVKRIDGIANDLLSENRKLLKPIEKKANICAIPVEAPKEDIEVALIGSLVEKIAKEKRFEFADKINVKIDTDIGENDNAFAKCETVQLSRILSNLVNNSVESLEGETGEISLGVRSYSDQIFIVLNDNGRGIPKHILEKLGERGVSYGKDNSQSGSGLGIYNAKKIIAEWGGVFEIRSRVGDGTSVEIRLPRAQVEL